MGFNELGRSSEFREFDEINEIDEFQTHVTLNKDQDESIVEFVKRVYQLVDRGFNVRADDGKNIVKSSECRNMNDMLNKFQPLTIEQLDEIIANLSKKQIDPKKALEELLKEEEEEKLYSTRKNMENKVHSIYAEIMDKDEVEAKMILNYYLAQNDLDSYAKEMLNKIKGVFKKGKPFADIADYLLENMSLEEFKFEEAKQVLKQVFKDVKDLSEQEAKGILLFESTLPQYDEEQRIFLKKMSQLFKSGMSFSDMENALNSPAVLEDEIEVIELEDLLIKKEIPTIGPKEDINKELVSELDTKLESNLNTELVSDIPTIGSKEDYLKKSISNVGQRINERLEKSMVVENNDHDVYNEILEEIVTNKPNVLDEKINHNIFNSAPNLDDIFNQPFENNEIKVEEVFNKKRMEDSVRKILFDDSESLEKIKRRTR